jgi:L-ascorbate metabolism protein UlaG (beta-lactamase superfamily)
VFNESFGIFQTPDAETIAKLKVAAPPFDRLTAVLVTHKDLDHINPAYVAEHLAHDPACALIAPAETIDLVRSQPSYAGFASRVQVIAQTGAKFETSLNQVKVRAIPLRHLPRPPGMPEMPFNVGYLFTVEGITFFHSGDMSADNLPALQRAGLAAANIDVLLINWYAFKPEDGRLAQAMIKYLNPKVVLLAHLTTRDAAAEKALVQNLAGLPPVVSLDTLSRRYEIVKDGLGLSVK